MTELIITQDLKPCPFCGGEASLRSIRLPMVYDCDDVCIYCTNCDVDGPHILFDQSAHSADDLPDLEAEAITAWNTRSPDTGGQRLEEVGEEMQIGTRCSRCGTTAPEAFANQCNQPECEYRNPLPSGASDELVERVARAISDANWQKSCTDTFLAARFNDPDLHEVYLGQARAAIATLSTPEASDTKGLVDATWEALKERCCADPKQAKKCIMVSRDDLAAALALHRGGRG